MDDNRTMEITVCEAQKLRDIVRWIRVHHQDQLDHTVTPIFRRIIQERIDSETEILTKLNKFLNVKE